MRPLRVMVIGVLLGATAGCADQPGDGTGVGGSSLDIAVRNNYFTPTPDTVNVGQMVTWNWDSGTIEHNVAFEDGIGGSVNQYFGSHSRTFTAEGTYRYHCTLHAPNSYTNGMVAQVVVLP